MDAKDTRHYLQTTKRLKTQFTSWAATMRATDRYARRVGHTSNDAIGNALFLWAKAQKPEELAELLEPYLDEFQRIWLNRDRDDDSQKGVGVKNVEMKAKRKGAG